ncbi:MAG: ATP-binding protein [Candidatus Aminicenantes bacterium]|nr:ATP-binding protein [Candidatus Aminicenantes bacterium]
MNHLSIAADLSEVDGVRQFLKDSLADIDISEEDGFKIELALVEMVVNVIRYAYPDGGGVLAIEIRKDRHRVIIEIRDSGLPFDPCRAPKPDIDEVVAAGRKGGLGIYLTRELMDECLYRRDGGQNILTLVKKL